MTIGKLKNKDINKAMKLLSETFKESVYKEDNSIEKFKYNVCNNTFLKERIRRKILPFYAAYLDSMVVGIIGLSKDYSHISILCIKKYYQNSGFGRDLFLYALEKIKKKGINSITVNSSPNAILFYEKIGFKINGDKEERDGILITPMKYIIKDQK